MTRFLTTTGPESSGKTTLATSLATTLQAPLVPEASRDYLTALYRRQPDYQYGPADLLAIARLQFEREQQALRRAPPFIVCDTDLLVIVVWSEVRYGHAEPELLELYRNSLAAAPRDYLLCDHSIPWEPDPLREHPHQRDMLAMHYRRKLAELAVPHVLVSGEPALRLQQSLTLIQRQP